MAIHSFFVNMNKSSIPATVPEKSEAVVPSTSFATVAEIHNVDVSGPGIRYATVLSPTAGTLCSGYA